MSKFNILQLQGKRLPHMISIEVEPGTELSRYIPGGSFMRYPQYSAPDSFGSVVLRKPTDLEIELGMEPHAYLIDASSDYRPLIPETPPSMEGLLPDTAPDFTLAGDAGSFLDNMIQGVSDTVSGAASWAKSTWTSLSPDTKKKLLIGGGALLALPLLGKWLKNTPLFMAIASNRSGGSDVNGGDGLQASGSSAEGYSSAVLSDTANGLAGSSDHVSGFVDVPTGYWKSALLLGQTIDKRDSFTPWDLSLTNMAGDPMSVQGLFVPKLFIDPDSGTVLPSTMPYMAPLLAGGVFDKLLAGVKKVGSAIVNSGIAKTVAGFIPGGSAALSIAKGALSLIPGEANGLSHEEAVQKAKETDSSLLRDAQNAQQAAVNAGAVTSLSSQTPSVVSAVEDASLLQTMPSSWTGKVDESTARLVTDIVANTPKPLGGSPVLAIPAAAAWLAWVALPVAATGAVMLWQRVRGAELPTLSTAKRMAKANPLAAASVLPAMLTAAAVSKATQFSGRGDEMVQDLSATSTAQAEANAHAAGFMKYAGWTVSATADANGPVQPAPNSPKSGFMKALQKMGKLARSAFESLPALVRNSVAFLKISGVLLGASFIAYLWWTGRRSRTGYLPAISKLLPAEMVPQWEILKKKIETSAAPLSDDEMQDFQSYCMVATLIAKAYLDAGLDNKYAQIVWDNGQSSANELQSSDPKVYEAAQSLVSSYMDELEQSGAISVPKSAMIADAIAGEKASKAALAVAGGATAGSLLKNLADGDDTKNIAASIAGDDQKTPDLSADDKDKLDKESEDMDLEDVKAWLAANPDADAKLAAAVQDAQDASQLKSKLLSWGVPIALVTVLILAFEKHQKEADNPSLFSKDFWNSAWSSLSKPVQRLFIVD